MTGTLTTVGHNIRLTGDESWPIVGGLVTPLEAKRLIRSWRGWKRHWHCYEKAHATARLLGGVVAVGTLTIYSKKMDSTYGFEFNPPFEFHAWVMSNRGTGGIIDLALPGTIELGLKIGDDIGPYLKGRKPIIMAQRKQPKWLKYHTHQMEEAKWL